MVKVVFSLFSFFVFGHHIFSVYGGRGFGLYCGLVRSCVCRCVCVHVYQCLCAYLYVIVGVGVLVVSYNRFGLVIPSPSLSLLSVRLLFALSVFDSEWQRHLFCW